MSNPTKAAAQKAVDKMYMEIEVTTDVGPDYYATFCGMDDQEMRSLVRFILFDRAKEINRKITEKTFNIEELLKITGEMLRLFSKGMLKAMDNGECWVHRAVGPAPTTEEHDAIDAKIKSMRRLIVDSFLQIMDEGKNTSAT
jgi:hypothetical protein